MRLFILAAIAVLVVPTLLFAAQPAKAQLPDTPAGRLVAGYIEAFNSDDAGALRAFLEANLSAGALAQRPVEQRLKALQQIKSDVGTLEPMKDRRGPRGCAHHLARGSKGSWLEIGFAFENGPAPQDDRRAFHDDGRAPRPERARRRP